MLHNACMTAILWISTDAWQHSHPVGKSTVEDFHKHLAHIIVHPLFEDSTKEVTPLFWRHREICKRNLMIVGKACQCASILMLSQSLHDRSKLQIYANQPIILCKEFTPFVCKHSAIGLDNIIYAATSCIFLLQSQRLFIEINGAHQWFTTMPGGEHLWHSLCLDILSCELLQHLIAHNMAMRFVVEVVLF